MDVSFKYIVAKRITCNFDAQKLKKSTKKFQKLLALTLLDVSIVSNDRRLIED